jgi:hypothetical protein
MQSEHSRTERHRASRLSIRSLCAARSKFDVRTSNLVVSAMFPRLKVAESSEATMLNGLRGRGLAENGA